jgi:hypothetical protein
MIDCLRRTFTEEGFFSGFYKGSSPNVYRAIVVNAAELGTYDTAKTLLTKKAGMDESSKVTHLISSLAAGFVATIASSPIDVVKTRYMNAATSEVKLYSSPLDCAKKIVAEDGFLALYNGVVPLYIRLGIWTLVFFMTYEQYQLLARSTWSK